MSWGQQWGRSYGDIVMGKSVQFLWESVSSFLLLFCKYFKSLDSG